MKVRITKTSRSTYWYNCHIGKLFEVDSNAPYDCYRVLGDGISLIDKEDCEVIGENISFRKFRHTSGNIATETHSGKNYRVTFPQNYTIPKWIVEDSHEWTEIPQETTVTYNITLRGNEDFHNKIQELLNSYNE